MDPISSNYPCLGLFHKLTFTYLGVSENVVWPKVIMFTWKMSFGSKPSNVGVSYLQTQIWYFPGWWFGTWFLFFHIYGNNKLPFDELHHFSEGLAATTKQFDQFHQFPSCNSWMTFFLGMVRCSTLSLQSIVARPCDSQCFSKPWKYGWFHRWTFPELSKIIPGLVNVYKKPWKAPCYQWVNQLFLLSMGHFQ